LKPAPTCEALMWLVLNSVFAHLELWGFRSRPPDRPEPEVRFRSLEEARWVLKEFLQRSENRAQLRSFMAWETNVEVWRYDDRKLEARVAEMLVRGELFARLYERKLPVRTPIERIKYFPPPRIEPEPGWIEIRIVWDHDGKGVGGLELELETPDGTKRKVTTNGQGTIRVDGLVRRGACHLESSAKGAEIGNSVRMVGEGEKSFGSEAPEETGEVKYLVDVTAHLVADRETLKKIADAAWLPNWKTLAKFNWGTEESEKVIDGAVKTIGSRRKENLAELVFSSMDAPGVLFVPKPFSLRGLTTNSIHYIRVHSIEFPRRSVAVSM